MTLTPIEQHHAALDAAAVALRCEQFEAAEAHLQRALSSGPPTPQAYLLEAELALLQGEAPRARAALDVHDCRFPQQREIPSALLLRTRIHIRLGEHDAARRLADGLAAQFPDDIRPHQLRAGLALRTDDDQAAIEHLHRVLALAPSDAQVRRLLATLLGRHDPQAASDLLKPAKHSAQQASTSSDLQSTLQYVRLLRRAGRSADAAHAAEHLTRTQAASAQACLIAGQIADEQGACDHAVRQLERAISLGGGREARAALALALVRAGRFAAAAGQWWRLAHQHDHDTEAWAGLLVCALAARRGGLARRVRHRLSIHSSRRERRRMLARLWQQVEAALAADGAAAEAEHETAAPVSPLEQLLSRSQQVLSQHARTHGQRADAHYHLAVCHHALGDRATAERDVERALVLNGRYTAAVELARSLRDAA